MDIETSFIKSLNVCFNLVYLSKLWIFLFTFFNKSWSSQNSFDAQLTPELHGQGTRPGSVPAVASDVWLERPLFLLPADFMYVVCVGCFCFCFLFSTFLSCILKHNCSEYKHKSSIPVQKRLNNRTLRYVEV